MLIETTSASKYVVSHWYGIQTHKQLTKHMCWSFGLSRRAALKCRAVRLSKADLGRDKSEAATRLTKAWRDSTCCWCCWYVATTHRNQDIHGCTCLQYAAKEGQARGTAGTSWHCLIRHLDESDKDSFIKFYQSWNQQDKRSYGDHHSPFFKIHPSKLKTFFLLAILTIHFLHPFVSAWKFHLGIFTLCYRTFGNLSCTLEISSPWFGDLAETRLNKSLQRLNKSPKRPNKSLQRLNKSLQRLNKSLQRLNKSLQRLNKSLQRLNKSPKRLNKSLQRLNKSPKRLNKSLQMLNKSPKRPNKSLQRPNKSPKRLNKSPKRLNKSLQRLNKSLQRLNKSPKRLNKSLQRLNKSPKRLNKSLQRLNKSPKRLNKSLQRLSNSLQRLNKSPKRLNKSLQRLNKSPKG